jgi:alpha-L-rhamnosidase
MVRLLDDKSHDGWANLLARGGTFTWEVWQPSDVIGDSMSHGWGANVLVSIQHTLLGVTPTSPGYTSFAVTPPRGVLTSASGTVPTPEGTITVSWHRHAAPSALFAIDLTVPANTTAVVTLPAGASAQITDSGRPIAGDRGVRSLRVDDGVAILRVGAGTYHLAA